jgi:hypothetical protein
VASIGEVPRFDVVLEENYPGDPLVNVRAAALYDRMLTTPKDLCSRVGHIFVLRLESVSRCERISSLRVLCNEELGSRLSVGPAGRALRSLDERVETTLQVLSHDEGKVGAHTLRVVTVTPIVEKGDPRYLGGSPASAAGAARINANKVAATNTVKRLIIRSAPFPILPACTLLCLGPWCVTNLRQPRSAARCSVSPFAHLHSPTHSEAKAKPAHLSIRR